MWVNHTGVLVPTVDSYECRHSLPWTQQVNPHVHVTTALAVVP